MRRNSVALQVLKTSVHMVLMHVFLPQNNWNMELNLHSVPITCDERTLTPGPRHHYHRMFWRNYDSGSFEVPTTL